MAATQQHECTKCGATAAMRCKACIEGLDSKGNLASSTYYCGKICQTTHWIDHKTVCRALNVNKKLYRAGEVIQDVFYAYREAAFDLDIRSVTRNGATLEVHDAEGDGPDGPGPLFPFPRHLVSDEADKKAILTLFACSDAVAFLHELRTKLFKGFVSSINHVVENKLFIDESTPHVKKYLDLKNGQVRTDEKQFTHDVVTVTLINGAKYIFDASGAQYGQMRAVIPQAEYLEHWAADKRIVAEFRHGAMATKYRHRAEDGRFDSNMDGRVIMIHNEIKKCMNAAIADWEEFRDTKVHKMLDARQLVYQQEKAVFVAYIESEVRDFVAYWESSGAKFSYEVVGKQSGERTKAGHREEDDGGKDGGKSQSSMSNSEARAREQLLEEQKTQEAMQKFAADVVARGGHVHYF